MRREWGEWTYKWFGCESARVSSTVLNYSIWISVFEMKTPSSMRSCVKIGCKNLTKLWETPLNFLVFSISISNFDLVFPWKLAFSIGSKVDLNTIQYAKALPIWTSFTSKRSNCESTNYFCQWMLTRAHAHPHGAHSTMFGMHVTGQAIITSERESHYTVCVCVCVPVNIANKYSISKFNIYDFHFNLRLCWCAVIFLYSPFQQPGQPVFFCCCFDSIRYEYEFFICSLCARVRTVCLALFLLFCAVYTDVYCCLLFVLHGFIILTHFLRATQFSSVFFAIVAVYCQSRTNCFFSLSLHIFPNAVYLIFHGARKKNIFFCSWFVTQKCMLFMHVWLANQQYHVLMFVSHLIQPKWNNTFTITATHCSIL